MRSHHAACCKSLLLIRELFSASLAVTQAANRTVGMFDHNDFSE